MPALYLFHRRTMLGGDDLQPAAFFTATLRVVQLLFLLLPILFHVIHEMMLNINNQNAQQQQQDSTSSSQQQLDDDIDNNDSNDSSSSSCQNYSSSRRPYYYLDILLLYTILSIVYNILTLLFLERPISYWSSIGAPTDGVRSLRSAKVAKLLEFKLLYASSILLFILWIMGVLATSLAPQYYHCQSFQSQSSSQSSSSSISYSSHRYYWTMLAPTIILLVTQLSEVIVSWTFLFSLCAQPREVEEDILAPLQQNHHDAAAPDNQQMHYYQTEGDDDENDNEQQHDRSARPGLQHAHAHSRAQTQQQSSNSSLAPPATQNHELVEEMWAERCANLCQCLGMVQSCFCFCFGSTGGQGEPVFHHGGGAGTNTNGRHARHAGTANALMGHSDFGEIARALADYLETRGVLDVVPSDIVTGFLVLQQLQKQRIMAARRAVLNDLSSQEESIGLTTGGASTTMASHRQNSLLMGSGLSSNSSTCSNNDGNIHHHYHHRPRHSSNQRDMLLSDDLVSGPAAASVVAAPILGMMAADSAAADAAAVDDSNIEDDSSLFVPLDSPPASANNCHKNQNVYQRSSQKSNANGNSNSTAPTTMAYHHLSALSTPQTPTITSTTMDIIADHHQHVTTNLHNVSGSGGGCYYQAFSSPTSATAAAPGVDASSRAAEQACRRSVARILLQRNNFTDMMALEEGARYAKYALAIYTWVLYLYVNPITGVFRLAGHAACSACSTTSSSSSNNSSSSNEPMSSPRDPRIVSSTIDENGHIEGDNLCHTHRSALLLAAGGLPSTDLVYAQLKSRFNQNPYCILLDHEWRNVVVSIRGTFSLEDCITDVLIEPESLEKLGHDFGFDATNQYCHGGVFACARNIYRDLERHGLLDQLLLPSGGTAVQARYPDYNLRLVGHSLGSATCTLLSFMLRPKFPNLKVINYCPVGCCLTWEMATACQDWCTSFVLDSDIVPRLSVESMEVLRDEILDLIARIKVNKVEVAKRLVSGGGARHQKSSFFFSNWCFDFPMDNDEFDNDDDNNNDPNSSNRVEDLLYPPDQVPDTDYTRRLAQFKAIQEDRRSTRALRVVKLYPPGKIVHLVKTGERRACIHGIAKCLTCCTTNVGFFYTPVWINNDDLDEIVVNPHMGTDHFPNRIASVLENVAMEFGLQS